jgi:hypothetical protein
MPEISVLQNFKLVASYFVSNLLQKLIFATDLTHH